VGASRKRRLEGFLRLADRAWFAAPTVASPSSWSGSGEPTSGRTTLAGLDLAAAAALLVIAHERGLEAFDTVLSLREGRISAQARR
jgi:hypothetical protein